MTNSTVASSPGFAKYSSGVDLTSSGTIQNSTITANERLRQRLPQGSDRRRAEPTKLDHHGTIGDVSVTGSGTVAGEACSLIQHHRRSRPAATTTSTGVPQLGTLNNGGPTDTVPISASSPVIDQGKDYAASGYDQRHVALFDDSNVTNAADGRDIGRVRTPPSDGVVTIARTTAASETRWVRRRHAVHRCDNEVGDQSATFTVDSDTQDRRDGLQAPKERGRST